MRVCECAVTALGFRGIVLTLKALRLYPPIPLNVRFAKTTTWLPRGGKPDGKSPVVVPKGTGVGLVPYYMHRRKDIYGEDAMDFRPERWEGPKLDDIGWAYMPFHGSPRLCLGSKLRSAVRSVPYAKDSD